ncbi:response regulator transcription factor [Salmonirosea aquatica]|uniref:Response regulator n=1 Tax=Salmonirosea aquatica TaxID=2654236 RepID=A0A7C9FR57_9BACT|nr:response regulator [Cytophagaceae bacterium SJW1-29]
MKLLLVEDEKHLADSILSYLRTEGYLCEWAADFGTASEKIALYAYDCALIDITLPGGNGLDLVRQFKAQDSAAGIIVISARNSLDDKIMGLDIGADDYLTKPFHLSELNARIKSLIRRRTFQGKQDIVFREITVKRDSLDVFVNMESVVLTKKELDLLLYFIANQNRVLTKESIAEHLWGEQADSLDSLDFIYTHIKNLRKKLVEKECPDYIHSVYGMGYKFTQPT